MEKMRPGDSNALARNYADSLFIEMRRMALLYRTTTALSITQCRL